MSRQPKREVVARELGSESSLCSLGWRIQGGELGEWINTPQEGAGDTDGEVEGSSEDGKRSNSVEEGMKPVLSLSSCTNSCSTNCDRDMLMKVIDSLYLLSNFTHTDA